MANTPIDGLDINSSPVPRVTNALKRVGIFNAETLAGWSREQLLAIHNIGENDLPRIEQALHRLGLSLSE